MSQLAPSKNPEKESKTLGIAGVACGIISLLIWFLGTTGLALSVRGIIISRGVHNKKYLTFSIIGAILSGLSLVWYFTQ